MRFFPRLAQDNYSTTILTGMVGMVRQLLGTMTLTPIYRVLHFVLPGESAYQAVVDLASSTGTVYGYWELDASLSPALLLLLAGGAIAFLSRKPNLKAKTEKKRLIAEAALVLAIWLVIEFTLAKGVIYPAIRNLPILESQRVNIRNICAFIFPLAVVGAVIFNNWTKNWKSKVWRSVIFLLLVGFALGCLLTFYYVPAEYAVGQGGYRIYLCNYRPLQATYEQIRYQGKTFPVENVIPDAAPMDVIQEDAVNLGDPYNTFFKDITRHLPDLHAGSVYDISDGYFNIVDPTGYVFPEVNHSNMYERIPVSDRDKFLDFINRRQPKWKLPVIQQVLDWTALITLIAEFGVLVVYLAKRKKAGDKENPHPRR